MSVISYLLLILPSESSLLPLPGIELTLVGYVTGYKQRLYPLCKDLRTSVYKFLGIVNLMSSATIFTSARIAILLLYLHVFFNVNNVHNTSSQKYRQILFLFLQQYLTCLIRLIWMVLVMGGKRPYSHCFVGYCFRDLFSTARCILVWFPV